MLSFCPSQKSLLEIPNLNLGSRGWRQNRPRGSTRGWQSMWREGSLTMKNLCHIRVSKIQCDQIGRFIELWATFQSLWQQLICPNHPYYLAIFVKVSKSFIFKVKTFLGNFNRHLATFYWSLWLNYLLALLSMEIGHCKACLQLDWVIYKRSFTWQIYRDNFQTLHFSF